LYDILFGEYFGLFLCDGSCNGFSFGLVVQVVLHGRHPLCVCVCVCVSLSIHYTGVWWCGVEFFLRVEDVLDGGLVLVLFEHVLYGV